MFRTRGSYVWAVAAVIMLWILMRRDSPVGRSVKDFFLNLVGLPPTKKVDSKRPLATVPAGVPVKEKKKPKPTLGDTVRKMGFDCTDDAVQRVFPRRYELHDHVVVVKMNHGADLGEFLPLAAAFAASLSPSIDVVIADTEGITGELRRPVHSIVYQKEGPIRGTQLRLVNKYVTKRYKGKTCLGDSIEEDEVASLERLVQSPTFTVHVENEVKYCFDVMRVMFCSGNTTERMHFSEVRAPGERVVDMFAGIGYFTLPLAINGGVKEIIALEKNPDSCWYLRLNSLVNGVGDKVKIFNGDNRVETGSTYEGQCDRVLMGYIPTCEEFLPRAYSFLRRGSVPNSRVGIIHYHFNAGERKEAYSCAYGHVVAQLGEDVAGTFTIELRQVKSYSPRTWHYVADVIFS
jgi:tRNA wybutosine-synthesizing protein 2